MSDSALKAVYAGDDILHLCVRYVSTHLTWVEEFKDYMFFKTKTKKCGFSVCEFIITRYILHLQWKLVVVFLWDSTLSNCHRDSVIVQSASPPHCRTRDLSAVCRDAGFTTRCLNCSKLCGFSESRGVIWIQRKVRQCWKMTGNAIHSCIEWVSMWAECRDEGEEKGETERHGPIQLCLRRRWLTQHVIPLLFFRAIIDPTTSSPLRVSIAARL